MKLLKETITTSMQMIVCWTDCIISHYNKFISLPILPSAANLMKL